MAAAGPGSAHLSGPAAEAAACDAVLTPVVTGQIDWAALDQLTSLWLTLHGHGPGQPPGTRQATAPGRLSAKARARLQATLQQACTDVVSGPGGIASYLRGAHGSPRAD